MSVDNLKIIYRDPRKLVAYGRNSRRHSAEQIVAIRASIKEFGFTNPVLLKDDEETIGAGHARVMAAVAEKIAKVPTITLAGLTEAQWRAYVIADNATAITGASWDPAILRSELMELQALNFPLATIGFPGAELASWMADKNAGLTDPDAAPEPPVAPVSRAGDVWLLGATVKCPKCGKNTPAGKAGK